jgi:hypothetical protein
MNLKGRRRYAMLARVNAFGVKRARAFPPATLGGEMFAEVRRIVADVAEHSAGHASSDGNVRQRTGGKVAARKALRESLQAMYRTALALSIDTPGIDRNYKLPRSNGDLALITAARTCVQHAQEVAARFVAHGLPSTFLDDVMADIERLELAIHASATAKNARVAARVRLHVDLHAALIAVRRLDAIVPNVLRGNPAALAAWRDARRIGGRSARGKKVVERSASQPMIRRIA